MVELRINRCKNVGCGKELPPYSGKGRHQEYCNDACRVDAWRKRKAPRYETPGPVEGVAVDPSDEIEAVAIGKFGSTDEQAAVAIMEWRGLISSTKRLARDARPELAWRFADASRVLTETLARLFGGDENG